jgi:hypothetical protein
MFEGVNLRCDPISLWPQNLCNFVHKHPKFLDISKQIFVYLIVKK